MKPLAQHRSGSWAQTRHADVAARQATVPAWEHEWQEAAAVERREAERARPTAPRRLVVLLPAAVLAAAVPTALGWMPGFTAADTGAAIIASVLAAIVAVAVVPLADHLGAGLTDRGADDHLLFTAALASAGAAAIHFSVIKMHLDEYTLYGAFFVLSGIAQLVWPIWLLLRRWPPLLVLGAIGNAAIAALWVADRVGATPVGPDATEPPPFGLADSVASGFELLIVAACVVALIRGRGQPLRLRQTLTLTVGAATLTTLGLLSVLGVGPGILPPAK